MPSESMIGGTPAGPSSVGIPDKSYGHRFQALTAGPVTHLRFYRQASATETSRTLTLWSDAGAVLATTSTSAESGNGWIQAALSTPVALAAGTFYRVSYNGITGSNHSWTSGAITSASAHFGTITAGYANALNAFPNSVIGGNVFADVVFSTGPDMAITAIPDPVHARIRLQVTGAADGPVTIRRADSNGAHTVRQYEDQVSAAGLLDLHDYEAALTGPITYTATDHLGNVASVTLDAGMGDDGDAPDGPWLSHPNLPALNTRVRIIEDLPTFNRRSTEHVIYGRAAPVYTTQPLQTRTGTLSLLCTSWDEWRQIHGLYKSGNAVLLRNTCLTDADYYHVGDLTPAPTVPSNWQGNWRVDIAYTAVDQPEGALVGTVEWSWDNTVAAHDTWADVLAAYDTWAELVMGPTP